VTWAPFFLPWYFVFGEKNNNPNVSFVVSLAGELWSARLNDVAATTTQPRLMLQSE
jgi:hypothetical protein